MNDTSNVPQEIAQPATTSTGKEPGPKQHIAMENKNRTERLAMHCKRIFRVLFGIVLLAFLGLLINTAITPIVLPVSDNAWVNCDVHQVRSEIEGTFRSEIAFHAGESVLHSQRIGVVTNQILPPSDVRKLRREAANQDAEIARIREELTAMQSLDYETQRRLGDYSKAYLSSLENTVDEHALKSKETRIAAEQARRVRNKQEILARHGAAPAESLELADETATMTLLRHQQADRSAARTSNELEAASQQLYLQRDNPIYLSQSFQTKLTIPVVQARLAEAMTRRRSIDDELLAAEEHHRRLSYSEINTPFDGWVWQVHATHGKFVNRGDALITLAPPPTNYYVEADISHSKAAQLRTGARVTVKVSGLGDHPGHVADVIQSSPQLSGSTRAIVVPRSLKDLRVRIQLEASPFPSDSLGRPCQVLVANEASNLLDIPGHLRTGMRWLFELF